MEKQNLINNYFKKLCKTDFFKNDEECIIGSAKNVIKCLEENLEYAKDSKNEIEEEIVEFLDIETNSLIKEIKSKYNNLDDIIELNTSQMLGFYTLEDKETLYNDLKEYYEEM